MKKRLVAIALIAVAILGIFTSCEKKEVAVDPNAPVKLTVWCWDPTFNIYAMNEAAKIYAKIMQFKRIYKTIQKHSCL